MSFCPLLTCLHMKSIFSCTSILSSNSWERIFLGSVKHKWDSKDLDVCLRNMLGYHHLFWVFFFVIGKWVGYNLTWYLLCIPYHSILEYISLKEVMFIISIIFFCCTDNTTALHVAAYINNTTALPLLLRNKVTIMFFSQVCWNFWPFLFDFWFTQIQHYGNDGVLLFV